MAVGIKGSFATTQEAGFDTAGMMRDAQKEQSRIANQKLAMDSKVEEAKSSIFSSMEEPSYDPTGEYNSDTLLYEGVGKMKDKLFEYHKQMENGDLTVRDLRGISASYNRQLSQFQDDVSNIQKSAEIYLGYVENKQVSGGLSDRSNLIIGNVFAGKVDDVEVAGDGSMVIAVNGEKMTLRQFRQMLENPPRNSNLNGIVDDLGNEFKKRVENTSKGFIDIKTEGLSDSHKIEIESAAKSLANNPQFHNDLVYEVYGKQDVLSLSEEEVAQLEKDLYDKMLIGVTNRVESSYEETLDRTNLRLSQQQSGKTEEPAFMVTGNPDLENQYQETKGLFTVTDPNNTEERVPLEGVKVLSNITGESIFPEVKEDDKVVKPSGQRVDTLNDFALESWFIDDDGKMVVRGATMEDLGSADNLVMLDTSGDSLTMGDARKKIPATTKRTSLVIDNTTEAARALVSAGLSNREAQQEIERMKQRQSRATKITNNNSLTPPSAGQD